MKALVGFRLLATVMFAVALPAGLFAQTSEPVLKPGIPGLKMVDVRELKHLEHEIDELQSWESNNRLTVVEYRSKVVEKTATYLGFEGAKAEQFTAVANQSVAALREAFRRSRQPDADLVAANAQYAADLDAVVGQLAASLDSTPRHQLFAPEFKKWLYRLTFGPKESKEAQEAKGGQAAASTPAPSAPPPPR